MSHNEDRELQIRLAELQADVEINLTACFGFLAGFVPLIILFEELYFSPSTSVFMKGVFVITAVALAVVLLFVTRFFIKRAVNARMQMSDLKKKYVW
jgi:hypothetical protein